MWFDILKVYDKKHNLIKLNALVKLFDNPEKGIGYMPITWSADIEEDIKRVAQTMGMQYKFFESQGRPSAANGNSFANGGHFMWKESLVLKMIDLINDTMGETIFDSVDSLIEFVATKPYWKKPYRVALDQLFGIPNVKLAIEMREKGHKKRGLGFE
tara:strand:- start:1033 stop:1503 length:471 start_codon:yes stop_codon:yes gene_type:complete